MAISRRTIYTSNVSNEMAGYRTKEGASTGALGIARFALIAQLDKTGLALRHAANERREGQQVHNNTHAFVESMKMGNIEFKISILQQ
jgi:hypothetical protein